jgi:uncharacterized protein
VAALSEEVKAIPAGRGIVPVATASAAGVPNAVPLRFVRAVNDGALVMADNSVSKSARHPHENSLAALAVWHPETRCAFQIKGRAEVLRLGSVLEEMAAWVAAERPEVKTKAAVVAR